MIVLALALPLAAIVPGIEATGLEGAAIVDTRTAPGFGDPTPGLRAYLERAGRRHGPQHVCVVGYRFADGTVFAEAHWREGRRLIRWDGSDPRYPASPLGWGRRDLDLDADVVADTAAVGGSTYLVTRAWVGRVLADCTAHGTRYVIASRRR